MVNAVKRAFRSWYIVKHPQHLVLLVFLGALFSHGLSLLISMAGIDNIWGSYSEVKDFLLGSETVLTWFKICLFTPIIEEISFRGLIYGFLKFCTEKITKGRLLNNAMLIPAMILSSVIFGIVHLNLAQGVYAFICGIILCYVYEIYGNLLAPVIFHAAANATALILEFSGFNYPNMSLAIASCILCFALSATILRVCTFLDKC